MEKEEIFRIKKEERKQFLRDYKIVNDRLLKILSEKKNYNIVEKGYSKLQVPMDSPYGEFEYFKGMRKDLEMRLTNGKNSHRISNALEHIKIFLTY